MTADYLTSPFQKEVLSAIASLDSAANDYYSRPLFVVDARSDIDAFRRQVSLTLRSITMDKWAQGKIRYLSEVGVPIRSFAIEKLRSNAAELDSTTKREVSEVLRDWQMVRSKRLAEKEEYNFESGIRIILPESGANLAFDLAFLYMVA